MKPVATADSTSYFALRATAAGIALVGVPGVTIEATFLEVKINSASDSRAGPNALPPAVINFEASFNNGTDPPA